MPHILRHDISQSKQSPQTVRQDLEILDRAVMLASLQAGWSDGWLACQHANMLDGLQACWPGIMQAVWPALRLACWQAGMLAGQLARRNACQHGKCLICVSLMIIVVANSKGGVGKSTIAVHLAGWLRERGHSVTLADCDTQRSSSEWISEAVPEVKTVRLATPDDILNELPGLDAEVDYVIADGPGSNTETSRALLLRADFAIVPCKASMLEVRALAQATDVLRQAQDIRGGMPDAKIVLSMVGKNYRLTRDMKDAAAALSLPVAKTPVTLRQIYADAPGQGVLVWNLGARGKDAADEIGGLFRELLPDLGGRKPKKTPKAKPRGKSRKARG